MTAEFCTILPRFSEALNCIAESAWSPHHVVIELNGWECVLIMCASGPASSTGVKFMQNGFA